MSVWGSPIRQVRRQARTLRRHRDFPPTRTGLIYLLIETGRAPCGLDARPAHLGVEYNGYHLHKSNYQPGRTGHPL